MNEDVFSILCAIRSSMAALETEEIRKKRKDRPNRSRMRVISNGRPKSNKVTTRIVIRKGWDYGIVKGLSSRLLSWIGPATSSAVEHLPQRETWIAEPVIWP